MKVINNSKTTLFPESEIPNIQKALQIFYGNYVQGMHRTFRECIGPYGMRGKKYSCVMKYLFDNKLGWPDGRKDGLDNLNKVRKLAGQPEVKNWPPPPSTRKKLPYLKASEIYLKSSRLEYDKCFTLEDTLKQCGIKNPTIGDVEYAMKMFSKVKLSKS